VEELVSCIINNLVHRFTDNQYDISMCRAAMQFPYTGLLLIREGKLQLSINDSYLLSHSELNDIIAHICMHIAQPSWLYFCNLSVMSMYALYHPVNSKL
jgi:hypothetical protein